MRGYRFSSSLAHYGSYSFHFLASDLPFQSQLKSVLSFITFFNSRSTYRTLQLNISPFSWYVFFKNITHNSISKICRLFAIKLIFRIIGHYDMINCRRSYKNKFFGKKLKINFFINKTKNLKISYYS